MASRKVPVKNKNAENLPKRKVITYVKSEAFLLEQNVPRKETTLTQKDLDILYGRYIQAVFMDDLFHKTLTDNEKMFEKQISEVNQTILDRQQELIKLEASCEILAFAYRTNMTLDSTVDSERRFNNLAKIDDIWNLTQLIKQHLSLVELPNGVRYGGKEPENRETDDDERKTTTINFEEEAAEVCSRNRMLENADAELQEWRLALNNMATAQDTMKNASLDMERVRSDYIAMIIDVAQNRYEPRSGENELL